MIIKVSNVVHIAIILLTLVALWAAPMVAPAAAQDHHHESDAGMPHDFSDAARWSGVFDEPGRDDWQLPAEVVSLMAIEKDMTVADLGAGTGYFLPHLTVAVGPSGKVLALEPEPNLVEYMETRVEKSGLFNVSVRQISYNDPELAPRTVDRILIVNTWHHINHRRDYVTKLAGALNPDGAVYIVDFTRESPSGPPVEHRLLPAEVIEELAAGGFEAELIEEGLPRQYVVVGRLAPRSHE